MAPGSTVVTLPHRVVGITELSVRAIACELNTTLCACCMQGTRGVLVPVEVSTEPLRFVSIIIIISSSSISRSTSNTFT